MKSLLKMYPELRPYRKKVHSVGAIGLQAIEYLKEILGVRFHGRILAIQCDVFVSQPSKPERATVQGIDMKDRVRSVFIEMIFTTGAIHELSLHAKVVARFEMDGHEDGQVWKPHHLVFHFTNVANCSAGSMRLDEGKTFIGL